MTNIERYNYAFDPDSDTWAARLLRHMPPEGTVLELGPGPGAMTKVLLARGHKVTVIENDPEALESLKTMDVEVISADLESPDWGGRLAERRFDAVLACDVLEHLRRPEDVLRVLSGLLQPRGRVIISIPNIGYAGVVAALRVGIFDYADKGQLDRTHVRFFTRRSVEKMLLDVGWASRVWGANRVPLEHSEFAWCWNTLSEAQRQSLLVGWEDFDVYQWMVVASPSQDTPAWEVIEARDAAEKLRNELQTLALVHQAERASLVEHQKAFSEAKELIGKLQAEVGRLRAGMEALAEDKTVIEARLAQKEQLDRRGVQAIVNKLMSLRRIWRRALRRR